MDIVGQIRFDGYVLDVYDSLDTPYFLAVQVAKLIDYSNGKTDHMLELLEADEKILINTSSGLTRQQRRALAREEAKVSGITPSTGDTGQGGKPTKWFVTELGLYNILSQSRKPIARKWRRIVHSNLIMMRRNNKLTIEGQFEEWDAMADNLFIDQETGELMEFYTIQGGDVEIRPYNEED